MSRNKLNEPLYLESESVIIEEIRPEFFQHVIKWRNDPALNQYLNQPYKLTMEAEQNWYKNIYLNDSSQGFVVISDKKNITPFATFGWTDYDSEKKQCICGRLILSDSSYAPILLEANFLLMDYLYKSVNMMYAHVAINNKRALRWNFMLGFEINNNKWEYPSEKIVNNIKQCEIYRSLSMYQEIRKKFAAL